MEPVQMSVLWLAVAAFAIGTEAFVIAGLLPVIASDLQISLAATGQLVVQAHDLQASLDEGPCLDAIEGKATYVTAQRGFAARGAALRVQLLDVCRELLGEAERRTVQG